MYNRVQLKRLVKIVELLRLERYPNSKRIVAELAQGVTDDLNELNNLRCSEKTAKRDIKLLKEEFHCPLALILEPEFLREKICQVAGIVAGAHCMDNMLLSDCRPQHDVLAFDNSCRDKLYFDTEDSGEHAL